MRRYLLDASALLAFMQGEPGSEVVRKMIRDGEAGITVLNLSEVATKLILKGMPSAEAEMQCRDLGLDLIESEDAVGFAAAALAPLTKHLGLSLGDRICLATAAQDGSVAVTADKVWDQVQLQGLQVQIIR